jgi:hypothetical protein
MLRKLALVGVALATLSLATPAQAFWFPFFRGRVVVGYRGYYGPGFAFGGHYYRGGYGGYRGGYGGFRGGGGRGGHR